MLVTAQLMRFHCRIPQHYLVLLSLSGCVVFAAFALVADAAALAVRVRWLCSAREQTVFAAALIIVIDALCALLQTSREVVVQ